MPNPIESLQAAAQLHPTVEILNNLGLLLHHAHRTPEALDVLRRAITLDPTRPQPHANLASVLRASNDLTAALASYQTSLSLDPHNPATLNNLAATLLDIGDQDQSITLYRQAVALGPSPTLHSNLLYALHFHPSSTPASLLQEHQQFLPPPSPPAPPRLPHPRLRIGYVSPDFHQHVISRFLLPILTHHDRTQFEIHLYSNMTHPPDPTTTRLQQLTDHWRPITPLTDPEAATVIRNDQIDLLVDLTMHMANNRLPLFALKPAPVQVTYLAYPSTTGLPALDHRLTDPHLDPPGTDAHYTERSHRLETYWCYHPPLPIPQSAIRNPQSPVTFGSLNNYRKVTPQTLDTWSRLLTALPHARLHLSTPSGPHRARLLSQFPPGRLTFLDPTTLEDYFSFYHDIDIALDPFPYAGGTTTLDAAYMGVPTVTLAGQTAVGRGGVSINTTLDLSDLITHTPDAYIRAAVTLASDLPRLAHLRATLRDRLNASILTDAPRFTRNLEAAYRQFTATPA